MFMLNILYDEYGGLFCYFKIHRPSLTTRRANGIFELNYQISRQNSKISRQNSDISRPISKIV